MALCCTVSFCCLQVDELNEDKVLFGPGREEQRDEKKLMVIFRCGFVACGFNFGSGSA
jgi:hypothetical protein